MNQRSMPEGPGLPTLRMSEGCARIELNRPHEHNRFEPADIETLSAMLTELVGQKGVRVLSFTARGPSFSSGLDLNTLSSDRSAQFTMAFAACAT